MQFLVQVSGALEAELMLTVLEAGAGLCVRNPDFSHSQGSDAPLLFKSNQEAELPLNIIRVLIADDHNVMREGIRALLDAHNDVDVVAEVADGREAVEKAIQLKPDIVLMDIGMPLIDGLEAARRIRKRCPRTRILVLTQHEKEEHVLASLEAGATGYVCKNAASSELLSAIRGVHRGDICIPPSAARPLVDCYLNQSDVKVDPYERLTEREREMLKLIADGRPTREIADLLFLSPSTVLAYRTRIMDKLDIHNRTDLIKYALRKGLITIDD
jgi:DNA-binding NarL/FixJ family response regulator